MPQLSLLQNEEEQVECYDIHRHLKDALSKLGVAHIAIFQTDHQHSDQIDGYID